MQKWMMLAIEIIVSLAIVAGVLYLVDAEKVLAVLASANPVFVALAIATYFLINTAMSWRIKIILDELKSPLEFKKILVSDFAGMLASDFTPARSGYFATAAVLSVNHGVPFEKAVVSILGPQLFDFLLKVCAGIIALMFVMNVLNLGVGGLIGVGIGVVAIFGMIVFGALMLFSKRFLELISFVSRFPLGEKLLSALRGMQEHAFAVKKLAPQIILLLLFCWMLKGVEWWFAGMALGISITSVNPFLFFLFLQPLVTLLQFVPIPTLAGIGVSEAGAVAILALFGVPAPIGAAYALLTRGVMIIVDLVSVNEIRRAMKNGVKLFLN